MRESFGWVLAAVGGALLSSAITLKLVNRKFMDREALVELAAMNSSPAKNSNVLVQSFGLLKSGQEPTNSNNSVGRTIASFTTASLTTGGQEDHNSSNSMSISNLRRILDQKTDDNFRKSVLPIFPESLLRYLPDRSQPSEEEFARRDRERNQVYEGIRASGGCLWNRSSISLVGKDTQVEFTLRAGGQGGTDHVKQAELSAHIHDPSEQESTTRMASSVAETTRMAGTNDQYFVLNADYFFSESTPILYFAVKVPRIDNEALHCRYLVESETIWRECSGESWQKGRWQRENIESSPHPYYFCEGPNS